MSKISFSISYAGLQLPIAQDSQGRDVTPLKPIADLFDLKWEEQRLKVTRGLMGEYLGTCTPAIRGADGQSREQTCILLSRVAAYLMSINPERVQASGNTDGARYLIEKQDEWADALHDYEEMGVAVNLNHVKTQDALRKQRHSLAHMIGIKSKTADAVDRKTLTALITVMAAELGVAHQPDLVD